MQRSINQISTRQRKQENRRISLSTAIDYFTPSFVVLDHARAKTEAEERTGFPILGNFHLFKMPSIPEDRRDTRHRRPVDASQTHC